MVTYTAKYTKIHSGYMGQIIEWPEVITEGKNIEECRMMLRNALEEMIATFHETPLGNAHVEQIPVDINDLSKTEFKV